MTRSTKRMDSGGRGRIVRRSSSEWKETGTAQRREVVRRPRIDLIPGHPKTTVRRLALVVANSARGALLIDADNSSAACVRERLVNGR